MLWFSTDLDVDVILYVMMHYLHIRQKRHKARHLAFHCYLSDPRTRDISS